MLKNPVKGTQGIKPGFDGYFMIGFISVYKKLTSFSYFQFIDKLDIGLISLFLEKPAKRISGHSGHVRYFVKRRIFMVMIRNIGNNFAQTGVTGEIMAVVFEAGC